MSGGLLIKPFSNEQNVIRLLSYLFYHINCKIETRQLSRHTQKA